MLNYGLSIERPRYIPGARRFNKNSHYINNQPIRDYHQKTPYQRILAQIPYPSEKIALAAAEWITDEDFLCTLTRLHPNSVPQSGLIFTILAITGYLEPVMLEMMRTKSLISILRTRIWESAKLGDERYLTEEYLDFVHQFLQLEVAEGFLYALYCLVGPNEELFAATLDIIIRYGMICAMSHDTAIIHGVSITENNYQNEKDDDNGKEADNIPAKKKTNIEKTNTVIGENVKNTKNSTENKVKNKREKNIEKNQEKFNTDKVNTEKNKKERLEEIQSVRVTHPLNTKKHNRNQNAPSQSNNQSDLPTNQSVTLAHDTDKDTREKSSVQNQIMLNLQRATQNSYGHDFPQHKPTSKSPSVGGSSLPSSTEKPKDVLSQSSLPSENQLSSYQDFMTIMEDLNRDIDRIRKMEEVDQGRAGREPKSGDSVSVLGVNSEERHLSGVHAGGQSNRNLPETRQDNSSTGPSGRGPSGKNSSGSTPSGSTQPASAKKSSGSVPSGSASKSSVSANKSSGSVPSGPANKSSGSAPFSSSKPVGGRRTSPNNSGKNEASDSRSRALETEKNQPKAKPDSKTSTQTTISKARKANKPSKQSPEKVAKLARLKGELSDAEKRSQTKTPIPQLESLPDSQVLVNNPSDAPGKENQDLIESEEDTNDILYLVNDADYTKYVYDELDEDEDFLALADKLADLFPTYSRTDLKTRLKVSDDLDELIESLFLEQELNDILEQLSAEAHELEIAEHERKYSPQVCHLKEIFQDYDIDVLERVLDEHHGDLELVTNNLLSGRVPAFYERPPKPGNRFAAEDTMWGNQHQACKKLSEMMEIEFSQALEYMDFTHGKLVDAVVAIIRDGNKVQEPVNAPVMPVTRGGRVQRGGSRSHQRQAVRYATQKKELHLIIESNPVLKTLHRKFCELAVEHFRGDVIKAIEVCRFLVQNNGAGLTHGARKVKNSSPSYASAAKAAPAQPSKGPPLTLSAQFASFRTKADAVVGPQTDLEKQIYGLYLRTSRLDLHHLKLAPAMQVTRRALNDWWSREKEQREYEGTLSKFTSRAVFVDPLNIITGRGIHSVGGVPVIRQSVSRYLQASGYVYDEKAGSFIVLGKK